MRILITGGTIVTASDIYQGDVLVEDERITTIGTRLQVPADRVIDAAGKYVLPGGIDCQLRVLSTTTVSRFSAPNSTTSVTSASNGV